MKHNYTHTGTIVGADARTRNVKLRATKTMWITDQGLRFKKSDSDFWNGSGFGNWPLYSLKEIKEIKEIKQ